MYWSVDFHFLQPGKFSDPVSVELVENVMIEGMDYEALSYVWGSATFVSDIIVNNRWKISISESLGLDLRHLRSETHHRVLWIDQICTYSHRSSTKPCRKLEVRTSVF